MVRLAVVIFAAAAAAYPWIADAILHRYLGNYGIHISESTVNYSGLWWSDVSWSHNGLEIRAESIAAPSLLALAGYNGRQDPAVNIKDLTIESFDHPDATEPPDSTGLTEVTDSLLAGFPKLERYLPSIKVNGINVIIRGNETAVIQQMEWRAGQVVLRKADWTGELPDKWKELVELPAVTELRLGRRGSGFDLTGTFSSQVKLWAQVDLENPGKVAGRLNIEWDDGILQGHAGWSGEGWLPQDATISLRGPALPGLQMQSITALNPVFAVDAAYNNQTGSFSISLNSSGQYVSRQKKRRPLQWSVSLQAEGDRDRLLVTNMDLDLPGFEAVLDRHLDLSRHSWTTIDAACLRWNLDVAAWQLPDWSGMAEGVICLMPLTERNGSQFSLNGSAKLLDMPDFIWPETIPDLSFQLEGILDQTSLRAESLQVLAKDLVRAEGQLAWDWDFATLDSFVLEGQLLPQFIDYWIDEDQLKPPRDGMDFLLQGKYTGSAWEHSGSVEANETLINRDWQADLKLSWQGRDQSFDNWQLEAELDDVSLHGSGSLDWAEDRLEVNFSTLKEDRGTGDSWFLTEPTRLLRRLSDEDDIIQWQLEPVKLSGPGDGCITVEGRWSGMGNFRLTGEMQHISFGEMQPWIRQTQWSTAAIESCQFLLESLPYPSGGYKWIGKGNIQGEWIGRGLVRCAAKGSWFIEPNRIGFTSLSVELDGVDWLQIEGVVPISLQGNAKSIARVVISPEEPMEINVRLEPAEKIPAAIAEQLPFEFDDLMASLTAAGTLASPRAKMDVTSRRLLWKKPLKVAIDSVMDVSLHAEIGVDSLVVDNLKFKLPGSDRVESVHAAIKGIDWLHLIEQTGTYPWNNLSGNVILSDWPISSLGMLLPDSLLPKGSFSLNLVKVHGSKPTGVLSLKGLSWHALNTGLFAREISGMAHLEGLRLEDVNLRASMGGGSAQVSGWIDFQEWKNPRFSIQFKTDRIDLVRRSDLILRGQAQLVAQYLNSDQTPILSGEVELVRSLWLRNLLDFTRQGVASVAKRPPYFTVTTQPFADWRLDIGIYGQNFLKLQSALLRGTASAEMHLGGTLAEPVLLGSASMSEGAILFPFASLKSSGMQAWIAEDDPYSLKLAGSGEGVAYGYLVQYQVSGTSELPSIQFNSIPSLAQHEILLMLTTGAIPSADGTLNASERTRRVGLFLGKDFFSGLIGTEGASRLEIRTGDGFSPFRREGEVLEFKVNDKWSVIGEYDDFNSYNVDLRRILLER